MIKGLLAREEPAYREAVRQYHASMLQLARGITSEKIADEVVQEAWVSILQALPKFERRSSLRTWILRIVANEAKTRLRHENRTVSLEAMAGDDRAFTDQFDGGGHWRQEKAPNTWTDSSPDELISRDELLACLDEVMDAMPALQATTLRLREHHDYSLGEICNILEVSESNVRVLLHRARSRVYQAVDHFEETGECCTS